MTEKEFDPATQSRRSQLTWGKESTKERINDLKDLLPGTFSNRELFLLCLAFGWQLKELPGVPPRLSNCTSVADLREDDWATFNSIAMAHTESYDVLNCQDDVLDIVENFAAGGLHLLLQQMDANENLPNYLAKEVWTKVKEWRDDSIAESED